MKKRTVRLDDETARWVRERAAGLGVSVSRLVRDVLQEKMQAERTYEAAMRNYVSLEAKPMSRPGELYPTLEDVHARR